MKPQLLILWLVLGLGCTIEQTGDVALRVFLAQGGPGALDLATRIRVGVVGGETVDVTVDEAFERGIAVPIAGDGATHQVRILGLDDAGTVVGRGDSAPITFELGSLTVVDVVLRPVGAFSGGLGLLTAARPIVRTVFDGERVWALSGASEQAAPDRVDVVDPWLTSVDGIDLPTALGLEPGVALGSGGALYLLTGAHGWRFDPGVAEPTAVMVAGAPILPGATVVDADDGWTLLGGLDERGLATTQCLHVTLSGDGFASTACHSMRRARRQPVAANAGAALVVLGGDPVGAYGEVLGAEELAGPGQAPSAGCSYGPASAVFVGDGSRRILSYSNGAFGSAGELAVARTGASIFRLSGDRFLVAGGAEAEVQSTGEVLTLGPSGQFATGGVLALIGPRTSAALHALPNGDALLIGGVDPNGNPATWLEVYTTPSPQ